MKTIFYNHMQVFTYIVGHLYHAKQTYLMYFHIEVKALKKRGEHLSPLFRFSLQMYACTLVYTGNIALTYNDPRGADGSILIYTNLYNHSALNIEYHAFAHTKLKYLQCNTSNQNRFSTFSKLHQTRKK